MGCFPINQSSGNNFELSFPKLPFSSTLNDSKKLTLHLYNTILPGCSFNVDELNWQGNDTKRINSNLKYNPFNVSFDVDESFTNWLLIYQWLSNVNNNNDKIGLGINEYSVDANLLIYDNYHKRLLSLKYVNVFPFELNDITLSYREGEGYLECSATFSYDYFEIIN